ncbi:MAG TPA: large conductance mechanosensitive channel protein MscL [Candidatus Limnocylindrales bacterium]|jgi:large conductance mechanosensitive channel
MLKGFRDFIFRGNVIDLAVAFIIGGAFATVVTSFVTDLLTPLLGLLGLPDLSALSVSIGQAELRYGAFLTAVLAFVLVAAAIYFFLVVPANRMREPTAATTKACPFCATEIPLAAKRCPHCTSELS